MASWGRKGGLMAFLNDSLGFFGARNIAAWAVAGGIAYVAWIIPQQQEEARRKAIVEEWKNMYKENPNLGPAYRAVNKLPTAGPGERGA